MSDILILHGWEGSSKSWKTVKEILENQGHKVFAPDLPGFGDNPSPVKAWSIDNYLEWVENFCEKQNLSQFFLLGHSFGGRIAIKFANQYPEKLKSLILCASAGIKPRPDLKTRIILGIAKTGNAIFFLKYLRRFKEVIRNLFYIFLRNKDYIKAKGVMRETIKKVLAEDLLPDLSKIKVKTLIIWGEKDKMVPAKYAHIFKKKIENSELEILPKIGHSPHLEIPEKFSEIILKFVRIS